MVMPTVIWRKLQRKTLGDLRCLKIKRCGTAEECREAVAEVLFLLKKRKLERLKAELGVLE